MKTKLVLALSLLLSTSGCGLFLEVATLSCGEATYKDYFSLKNVALAFSCITGVTSGGSTSAFNVVTDTSLGASIAGNDEYAASVSGADGRLYLFSQGTQSLKKFDPTTGVSSDAITPATAPASWLAGTSLNGAYLHPNGKIYVYTFCNTGVGSGTDIILEYDPATNGVQTFGSGQFEDDGGNCIASGATMGPDGKLYLFPDGHIHVQVVDVVARTITKIGSVAAVGNHWVGGVVAPNGKVYGLPFGGTDILEVDPRDFTVTTFGSITTGGGQKFRGAAVAPNGKIYAFPAAGSETRILEVDPNTHATQWVATVGANWYRATLAPSGKIFATSQVNNDILEFDPNTYAFTVHTGSVGSAGWLSLSLATNGKLYGTSRGPTGNFLVLDPKATNQFPVSLILSPFLNGSH